MARQLDPKLQRIVEEARHNVQVDSSHTSVSHHSVLNSLDHNPDLRQSGGSSSVLAPGFLPVPAVLDSFDRNVLHVDNTFRRFDSKNDVAQNSPVTTVPSRNANLTKYFSPFIYGRQITTQESRNERAYTSILRAHGPMERPQSTQLVFREPTAILYGIDNINELYAGNQEPTTPLNLAKYKYNPVVKTATTPSSGHEPSSPSTRISLRRTNNWSMALTLPELSYKNFSNEHASITPPQRQKINDQINTPLGLRYHGQPPRVQGVQLVSLQELPDRFRQVFPYDLFNAVQSKCFFSIYNTTDNVVVAAPTGSGKTAVMELAICKLVQDFGSEQFKIVYQAPTRSLCTERVRDWEKKFSHLGLSCAELTGDTDNSDVRKVSNAAIIVTTPEKWDSITRKWRDHFKLLQWVKLVLIDEVHILKDPRGATLEAVVSRMKSIGAMVRFVALSATVPNSEDIATWLGKDHTNGHLPAHREVFGEEFRPVKLQKHVYGFSSKINDFAFDTFLDTKLRELITKHTVGKPMMVFCVTRKSCENTAIKLAQWWSNLHVTERPWPVPPRKIAVGNPDLHELIGYGVAFHHAGLDTRDRTAVETGFLRDGLSVICCTSTLAVGINLPCHLVVIKNTVCYKDMSLSEYSDLEIMQMLGRAGRPQFDETATAIIMTRSEKVDHYDLMISGQEILESTLHLNLIEHLNSEIGLGTVRDVYSAKRWLAGTFLSVRLKKNPTYYKFSCDTGSRDTDERLEAICERDIELLKSSKLITEDLYITCTDYGKAMTKYMVQFETMKIFLSIPKNAKMMQILHVISQSSEFRDLRLKPMERATFRDLNKSPFIKSPIKENITTAAHKVYLIIQTYLGGVDLPMDKEFNIIRRQFQMEKAIIFERILRLIRCIVECKAYDCDGTATCNALELLRSIAAGYWEDSTLQLRQLPTIGAAAVRKLVQSGIKSITQLATMDSATIERKMSRNPPFGKKILDYLATFPQLTLEVAIGKKFTKVSQQVIIQVMALLGYKNTKFPAWNRKVPIITFTATLSNGTLAHIWRGSLKRLDNKFEIAFTCKLSGSTDTIICQLACEEVVGTIQSVELYPEIPASAFEPPDATISLEDTVRKSVPFEKAKSAEEKASASVELEIEDDAEHKRPGSDYSGDSIFDDFVNVDDIETTIGGDREPETICTDLAPVQMENGKWRCNHKCRDAQGNYRNKNGAPCKHLCCHKGLDKPRKPQKKKVTKFSNSVISQKSKATAMNRSGLQKKSSEDTPKLRLKPAQHDASFRDIEEIDLLNELLEVESVCMSPTHYLNIPSVSSAESKPDSRPTLKKVPQYSYASSARLDLSLRGHFDDSQESPSPPVLLDGEHQFTFDCNGDSRTLSQESSSYSIKLPPFIENAPTITEDSEITTRDFNDSQPLETAALSHNLSSNKNRPARFALEEPEAKRRRIGVNNEISEVSGTGDLHIEEPAEQGVRKPLPAWVAEFDQDLIAFFGNSVEYAE